MNKKVIVALLILLLLGLGGLAYYLTLPKTVPVAPEEQVVTTPEALAEPTFTVTSVVASVTAPVSNACPAKYDFSAVVTANMAGKVTYRWERSDGVVGVTQTLTFVDAGSITVKSDWTLSSNFTGWKEVHILTPNDLISNQTDFTLKCPVFSVTGVTVSVSPTSSDTCSPEKTFDATGTITANGAGTVNYRWDKSDGTFGSTQSVVFNGAETKTVTSNWNLSSAGDRWFKLHVLTPMDKVSDQANFTLSCPFRVNSVSVSAGTPTGSSCASGKTTTYTGTIVSNAAGDVKYEWIRSDGASDSYAPYTVHFDGPGSKEVTTTWTRYAASTGGEKLHTITPTDKTSDQANSTVTCP